MSLNPESRDKLKPVSTAALCTALFKRGLSLLRNAGRGLP
jgi:hypothetical protein